VGKREKIKDIIKYQKVIEEKQNAKRDGGKGDGFAEEVFSGQGSLRRS